MRGEIMEISNKTLVWIVVATIIVSIGGTILTVKNAGDVGYATSNVTGNASVTVASQTVLRFAVSSLNFGSGSVNTTGGAGQTANCTLVANATTAVITRSTDCINFNGAADSLTLENAGNTFLNISVNFSTNSAGFPGGSLFPQYRKLRFTASANETGSCSTPTNSWNTSALTWVDVTPTNMTYLCYNLSWNDTIDTIRLGLEIAIPSDADGTKALTIVAQGTSI
jgi:hypothetical protein